MYETLLNNTGNITEALAIFASSSLLGMTIRLRLSKDLEKRESAGLWLGRSAIAIGATVLFHYIKLYSGLDPFEDKLLVTSALAGAVTGALLTREESDDNNNEEPPLF